MEFVTEKFISDLATDIKKILANNQSLKESNVLIENSRYDTDVLKMYVWGNSGFQKVGNSTIFSKFSFELDFNIKGQYIKMFIPDFGYIVYNEIVTAALIVGDYKGKSKHELFQ